MIDIGPDWKYWCIYKEAKLGELINLACDVDPLRRNKIDELPPELAATAHDKFKELYRLAARSLGEAGPLVPVSKAEEMLHTPIDCRNFREWLEAIGWAIPEGFPDYTDKSGKSRGPKPGSRDSTLSKVLAALALELGYKTNAKNGQGWMAKVESRTGLDRKTIKAAIDASLVTLE